MQISPAVQTLHTPVSPSIRHPICPCTAALSHCHTVRGGPAAMTSQNLPFEAVVVFSAERPSATTTGCGTKGASYGLVVKALYNRASLHQKELIANFFPLPLTQPACPFPVATLTRTPSHQETCYLPTFPFSYLNSSLLQGSLPRSVPCHYLTSLHGLSSIFAVCIDFFAQFCFKFAYCFNYNIRSLKLVLCLVFERPHAIGERIGYELRKTCV